MENRNRVKFWDGCRIALIGHVCTRVATSLADELWHILGHVAVSLGLYAIEKCHMLDHVTMTLGWYIVEKLGIR